MYGSDHRPVIGLYDLSLRKTYGGTLYTTPKMKFLPCSIEITDIQYHIISNEVDEKSLQKPLFFEIFGDGFLIQTGPLGYCVGDTKTNSYILTKSQSPVKVFPYVYSRYYLRSQCLQIQFYSGDVSLKNHTKGNVKHHSTGYISLHNAFDPDGLNTPSIPSKSVVSHDGIIIGELEVTLSMRLNSKFTEKEKADKALASSFYNDPDVLYTPPSYDSLLDEAEKRANDIEL